MPRKKGPEKNAAAVALGRKGGRLGGPARAAKLTPEERSEIARKAVRARWDKADAKRKEHRVIETVNIRTKPDTSDHALLVLLQRIKTTDDRGEIRKLTEELERLIFHKQHRTA